MTSGCSRFWQSGFGKCVSATAIETEKFQLKLQQQAKQFGDEVSEIIPFVSVDRLRELAAAEVEKEQLRKDRAASAKRKENKIGSPAMPSGLQQTVGDAHASLALIPPKSLSKQKNPD